MVPIRAGGVRPPESALPGGQKNLLVTYRAEVERGCHLVLGWPIPTRVLDLHAECCLLNVVPTGIQGEPPRSASAIQAMPLRVPASAR